MFLIKSWSRLMLYGFDGEKKLLMRQGAGVVPVPGSYPIITSIDQTLEKLIPHKMPNTNIKAITMPAMGASPDATALGAYIIAKLLQ